MGGGTCAAIPAVAIVSFPRVQHSEALCHCLISNTFFILDLMVLNFNWVKLPNKGAIYICSGSFCGLNTQSEIYASSVIMGQIRQKSSSYKQTKCHITYLLTFHLLVLTFWPASSQGMGELAHSRHKGSR